MSYPDYFEYRIGRGVLSLIRGEQTIVGNRTLLTELGIHAIAHACFIAKPPVKPDRDSASDADWQMARHRERVIDLDEFERVLRSRSLLDWRKPVACGSRSFPVESSNWLASGPIGLRRSLLVVIASFDPARFNVPNSYTGCRNRIALLDQVARLPQRRGQE